MKPPNWLDSHEWLVLTVLLAGTGVSAIIVALQMLR
mgnify:CR=1 FL=1